VAVDDDWFKIADAYGNQWYRVGSVDETLTRAPF
jgi:hypothetical protein